MFKLDRKEKYIIVNNSIAAPWNILSMVCNHNTYGWIVLRDPSEQ